MPMHLFFFLSALAPSTAHANGQTTHVWITLEAVGHLDDGPLKELLSKPEVFDALVNGAMFPDGGYANGDHYGELAHWEPLQQAYLRLTLDGAVAVRGRREA